MSEFTREQIIEAAKHCMESELCANCPLFGAGSCERVKNEFLLSLAEKEEPAPSDNDTSSNNNNSLSHFNDTSKAKICQALDEATKTVSSILDIYQTLTEAEQRLFDLGETYGQALRTQSCLEELKAGEQK